MNPQRDRGIRAEREACYLLSQALDLDVRRRATEGIREDVGDLVGVPDCTIQVSAVPDDPTIIAKRATGKAVDAETQALRADTRHAVVLLRVDGGHWRAIVTTPQLHALGYPLATAAIFTDPPTLGHVIRWAPHFADRVWSHAGRNLWVSTLDGWARTYLTATNGPAGATNAHQASTTKESPK